MILAKTNILIVVALSVFSLFEQIVSPRIQNPFLCSFFVFFPTRNRKEVMVWVGFLVVFAVNGGAPFWTHNFLNERGIMILQGGCKKEAVTEKIVAEKAWEL